MHLYGNGISISIETSQNGTIVSIETSQNGISISIEMSQNRISISIEMSQNGIIISTETSQNDIWEWEPHTSMSTMRKPSTKASLNTAGEEGSRQIVKMWVLRWLSRN